MQNGHLHRGRRRPGHARKIVRKAIYFNSEKLFRERRVFVCFSIYRRSMGFILACYFRNSFDCPSFLP